MSDSSHSAKAESRLQAVLDFAMPRFRLAGTGYELLWQEEKRRRDRKIYQIAAYVAAIGFALQFFAVDLPVGLQPVTFWASYRLGVSAALLVVVLLLRSPSPLRLRLGAVLWIAAVFTAVMLQAIGTVSAPQTPIVFSVFLCAAAAAVPPVSGLAAALMFIGMALLQTRIFAPLTQASSDLSAQLTSLYGVGFGVLMLVKVGQIGQVRKFLMDMRELERQRQIISLQSDLVSQLRSFLPKVIFDRITLYKKSFRTSFEYATQEVLRPRSKDVACLWSDIRGFTRASSDGQYIEAVAAPNIRHLTDLSEACGAIPRVIGDLLLCYYDEQEATTALMNSLTTASRIIAANDRWNSMHKPEERVDRVILLSWGRTLVGNVGGSASSREITALGPCVNQLARLDEAIGSLFRTGDRSFQGKVVATTDFVVAARNIGIEMQTTAIPLSRYDIKVRDFPEIDVVYAVDDFRFIRQGSDELSTPWTNAASRGAQEVEKAV